MKKNRNNFIFLSIFPSSVKHKWKYFLPVIFQFFFSIYRIFRFYRGIFTSGIFYLALYSDEILFLLGFAKSFFFLSTFCDIEGKKRMSGWNGGRTAVRLKLFSGKEDASIWWCWLLVIRVNFLENFKRSIIQKVQNHWRRVEVFHRNLRNKIQFLRKAQK